VSVGANAVIIHPMLKIIVEMKMHIRGEKT